MLLLDKVREYLPAENIVVSEYMDVSKFDNIQNVYYQVYTWSQGAHICNTKFCVKRSNCKFDNIDPLIEAINKNPGKIISISAFFRPCPYYYCASDFVIGTNTEEAKTVTEKLLASFREYVMPTTPAERKICLAILAIRGLIPANDGPGSKEQMRNNYYIIDVNEMKPKMYWHNIGPFYSFNPGHYDCIRSIDDF